MTARDVDNPFTAPGRWLKGALHVHTTESDGKLTPRELAELYRDLGWDFLFFTEHGKVTQLDEPPDGILTLPGIELGIATESPDKSWHFVGLDVESDVPAPGKFASPEEVYEHTRSRSALCMIAHPYWSQLSGSDLTLFDGLWGVEVWNTGCEVEVGRGVAEYQLDWCLGSGRRVNPVAVDDCHRCSDDVGGGWVMVKTEETSLEGIIDALRSGMFYSSSGPEIRDVRLTAERIEVETSPCRSIGFVADRQSGARVVAEDGGEITSATYEYRGHETVIRVQCTDTRGRKAWSNPFFPEWPPGTPDAPPEAASPERGGDSSDQ